MSALGATAIPVKHTFPPYGCDPAANPQRRYEPDDGGEAAATCPMSGRTGAGPRPNRGTADHPPLPRAPRAERDPCVGLKRACGCSPFPPAGGPTTWLILPVTYACLKD